ncbi:MAG TPA: DinB family protein [Burkholderiaceae bacterium]
MNMQNYFETLARYHIWATDKVLAEVGQMIDAHYRQDCGLFFKSVHGTLNHMLVGEQHWYSRFAEGISLTLPLNAELETDRALLASALRDAVKRWSPWIATLDLKRFEGNLHYTRTSGGQVVVPFASALGHVFNHGTHHRGQVSAALTATGYKVPEMDLIYMLQLEMKR